MGLPEFWFGIIAVLWVGYFFLEGFDFGVGVLLPVLSHDELDRRVIINTIGPVWDGNEVWVLVAGGATFAAFPNWYATLFSGFYLALLLILLALIMRGVAFEYRGKRDSDRWRRWWDRAIFWGSVVPAFLWGVAFANIVRGVPIDADHEFTGNLLTLLNPYALLGGVVTLALFTLHGAYYLGLKTEGEIRARALRVASQLGIFAVLGGAAFLLWTQAEHGRALSWALTILAALTLVAAVVMGGRAREGWAFALTGLTLALVVVSLFATLYPNVMPSSTSEANNLTITNSSSSHYTLTVMTWVALVVTPFVLLYQGWTYWVFRRRIGRGSIPPGVHRTLPSGVVS